MLLCRHDQNLKGKKKKSSLNFSLPHLRCFSSFRSSLLFPASLLRSVVRCMSGFSSKVVFSLPKEVVSYLLPSSGLPLLPLHTSCLPFHWQKTATVKEVPHHHPHAYSPVCGHPHVFLPTCCPARGSPLLEDQPSHPLSPCQGTFLVFSPPSVSRVFPISVQTCFGSVLSRGTFHTDGNILICVVQ